MWEWSWDWDAEGRADIVRMEIEDSGWESLPTTDDIYTEVDTGPEGW